MLTSNISSGTDSQLSKMDTVWTNVSRQCPFEKDYSTENYLAVLLYGAVDIYVLKKVFS